MRGWCSEDFSGCGCGMLWVSSFGGLGGFGFQRDATCEDLRLSTTIFDYMLQCGRPAGALRVWVLSFEGLDSSVGVRGFLRRLLAAEPIQRSAAAGGALRSAGALSLWRRSLPALCCCRRSLALCWHPFSLAAEPSSALLLPVEPCALLALFLSCGGALALCCCRRSLALCWHSFSLAAEPSSALLLPAEPRALLALFLSCGG